MLLKCQIIVSNFQLISLTQTDTIIFFQENLKKYDKFRLQNQTFLVDKNNLTQEKSSQTYKNNSNRLKFWLHVVY